MLTHDDILDALQQKFPSDGAPGGVFLVARLREPALGLDDPRPYVFIPDTHLVPPKDANRFRWVTAGDAQVDLLARLAELLGELRRSDASLRVWQLGDCFDLWRTGEIGGDPKADVSRVQDSRPALFKLLYQEAGCQVLAGNHDQELLKFQLPGGPRPMDTVYLDRGQSGADAVLLHGHQFDPIETLSRDVKELFARGATELVRPTPRSMLEAANPHWNPAAISLAPPKRPGDANQFLNFGLRRQTAVRSNGNSINVVPYKPSTDPTKAFVDSFGGPGRKPTVDGPRQTFFTDIAWWAQSLTQKGHDVRLAVIGHTHRARIVRGRRADGRPFVLMDCGAFVGSTFLSDELDAPIANAQIGVKVANDLRIYHLGYAIRRREVVNPSEL